MGSDTSLARTSRAELGSFSFIALLRSQEQDKRSHHVQQIANSKNNFHLNRVSASGATGPSRVAFLKGPDARAEAACKFKMTHHQPERKYTWNNMVALWWKALRLRCTPMAGCWCAKTTALSIMLIRATWSICVRPNDYRQRW